MSRSKLWTPGPAEFAGVDPWWHLVHDGPRLMQEAREARKMAKHYNGFNVGGLAVAASSEGDYHVARAANQKLVKGETNTKICAEIVAAAKIKNIQDVLNKGIRRENKERAD